MAELKLTRRFADGRMRKELRSCEDPWQRRRLDAVRLMKCGYGTIEAAAIIDCSRTTVRTAVLTFNERGFEGLVDGRSCNGRKRLLTTEQDAALLIALQVRVSPIVNAKISTREHSDRSW